MSPLRFVRRVAEDGRVRFGLWVLYVGIAVVGTVLFGFTFGLVFTHSGSPLLWAVAITVAAGAGWAIFLPAAMAAVKDRRRRVGAVHAGLLTMVYGEAILEAGTILNLIGYWRGSLSPDHALVANLALVGVSNVVMGLAMVLQMRELGVRVWRTVLLWIVLLNGVGVAVFVLFFEGLLEFNVLAG